MLRTNVKSGVFTEFPKAIMAEFGIEILQPSTPFYCRPYSLVELRRERPGVKSLATEGKFNLPPIWDPQRGLLLAPRVRSQNMC